MQKKTVFWPFFGAQMGLLILAVAILAGYFWQTSQSAYRHGRQDGARQAIGLKETGKAADWALEK